MAIQNLEIQLTSIPANTDYYLRWYSAPPDVRNMMTLLGDDWMSGREANSTYELFNDGTLQIQIVTGPDYNGRRNLQSLKFKNLVDNIEWTVTNNNFGNGLYVALGYDDELQTAYYFAVGKYYYNNSWEEKMYGTLGDDAAKKASLYRAITHAIPVLHEWKPVPAVTGKLGTFNFSMVKEEHIGDGSPVTDAPESYIERLTTSSYLPNMFNSIQYNTEIDVIYSGQVDKMTVEVPAVESEGHWIVGNRYLKFYMAGASTPFYISYQPFSWENRWLGFIIDEDNEVAKICIIKRDGNTYDYLNTSMSDAEMGQMYLWLHSHIPEDDGDSMDNYDNESDEGGTDWNPWFNFPVPDSGKPQISAIDTGFTTMYKMDVEDLRELSDYLWTNTFVEAVSKFFSDPREIIIGLMIMPVSPTAASSKTEIKAGRISTGVSGYKVSDQYKLIDMGSLNFHEVSHTFLDYSPNTSCTIVLPYCGEHSLNINEIQNETLHLYYCFDVLNGSCVAILKVGQSYSYCFGGQCGVQIPTSSQDFSRAYSGVLAAGASLGTLISSIATGGLTAPIGLGSVANVLSNGMNMSPTVTSSTGGGGTSGFLGNQIPFVKIEIPKPLMASEKVDEKVTEAARQYSFVGKTTYRNMRLGSCRGFTKCLQVHLEKLKCTSSEQASIERALMDGVIINPSGSTTPTLVPAHSAPYIMMAFMKMTSENNVIGKTWKTGTEESEILKLEGAIVYNWSVSAPRILIEGDLRGYNYCYIPLFERYYFITDIVIKTGNTQEVSLSVDVLQSFKGDADNDIPGILTSRAIVERQQNSGNLYMTDSYVWTRADKDIITNGFTGGSESYRDGASGWQAFIRDNNCYILTIAGSS